MVFISHRVLTREVSSLRLSDHKKGFKAQGATIREINGLFNLMTQMNLEAGIEDQIWNSGNKIVHRHYIQSL